MTWNWYQFLPNRAMYPDTDGFWCDTPQGRRIIRRGDWIRYAGYDQVYEVRP